MQSSRQRAALALIAIGVSCLFAGCQSEPETKRFPPPAAVQVAGDVPVSPLPGVVGEEGTITELRANVGDPAMGAEAVPMRVTPNFLVIRSGRTVQIGVDLGNGTPSENLYFWHEVSVVSLSTNTPVSISDVLVSPVLDHKLTLAEAQAAPPHYDFVLTTKRGLTDSYRVWVWAFGFPNALNNQPKGAGNYFDVIPVQ